MRRLSWAAMGVEVAGHALGHEAQILAWPVEDQPFGVQLSALCAAIPRALDALELTLEAVSLVEVFLSDPINQAPRLDASPLARWGRLSRRGMPPRPPARLAARLVLQRGERRHVEDGLLLDLGGHRELWLTDLTGEGEDARAQTEALLSSLVVQARALGFEPFEHLLRTWIYVHDIDAHYAGMVQGRARIYEALGFKEQARFPASTGIGGDPVEPGRWVTVNALLADHPPEALRRVHAPDHLPAASSYGVAFDRALSVEDAEKRAVHISGTASIDPEGQILYDDAQAQATRTLENITALLKDADAPVAGLVWLIVYLRDLREAARVEAALAAAGWGATPKLIVQGPVCRPGWLVEIEGLAWIKREEDR